MRAVLTPRWLLSHLFVLVMIFVMINLGFWQLRRLDERRSSNEAIAAASTRPAFDLGGAEANDLAVSDLRDFTAVRMEGTYLVEQELLVANRSFEGAAGFWMVTPMELTDGRVVAVVRGWVPRRVVAGVDERPTAPPTGSVSVEGLAFDSVDGGRIADVGPDETPQLSRLDLDRYREVTGIDVIDRWVRLSGQDPPQPGELPVPVPPPPLDEGPHLSYAVQWFFFSAGTAVVYWLILRRASSSA